jgi:SnoaL-like domain
MSDQDRDARLDRLLDRTEIYDLVRWERFCRDQRDWAGLLANHIPGSRVRTSWYDGDIAGFVEQSREKMLKGSSGKHWIMPAMLRIKGDRAIVESPAFIYDRLTFDGIEFDFHQYCRFFSRVVRTKEGWRLASFEGIYQRDNLQTTDPRNPLPVDWDIIKTLRPSYRFMGYTQLKRGYKLNPELIGDDRPDLVEAFYAAERRWLETGE